MLKKTERLELVDAIRGFALLAIQLLFSTWWLKRYKQGPFEYVWKKLTFINSKKA